MFLSLNSFNLDGILFNFDSDGTWSDWCSIPAYNTMSLEVEELLVVNSDKTQKLQFNDEDVQPSDKIVENGEYKLVSRT